MNTSLINKANMGGPDHETASRRWSDALRGRAFRVECAVTMVFLLASLFGLSSFLEFVEDRPGVVLDDPVLALIPPSDFTWLTFAMIYAGVVLGIISLAGFPRRLLLALQSYIVMVVLRIVVMFTLPLDPPAGLIPLVDPFVQFFGSGRVPTKDLFFSGHTATLFLLGLVAPGKVSRVLFYAASAIVGVCVLLQHVHYTVDVLVAPCFAYVAYRGVALAQERREE